MQTSLRSRKKGMPPGSLIHIGSVYSDVITIALHRYSSDSWTTEEIRKKLVEKPEEIENETLWYQVTGLTDSEPMEPLFQFFGIDPMISEDILNTRQNAKIDISEQAIALSLKNIYWDPESLGWESEQITLVLNQDKVISFAEKSSGLLNPLLSRLEVPATKIRRQGPDYTFYAIIDLLVDGYLENTEKLEIFLDDLELKMEENPYFDPTNLLHQIRKFQIYFRQQVAPVRDGFLKFLKDPDHLIQTDNLPYFQDVYDHLNQVMAQLDQFRESVVNFRELYQSQLNLRMNKTIHFLTLISTIFIPLTFIVGLYGMNFANMPELKWKYGYFAVLILMGMIGTGLYLYFRKKKWM